MLSTTKACILELLEKISGYPAPFLPCIWLSHPSSTRLHLLPPRFSSLLGARYGHLTRVQAKGMQMKQCEQLLDYVLHFSYLFRIDGNVGCDGVIWSSHLSPWQGNSIWGYQRMTKPPYQHWTAYAPSERQFVSCFTHVILALAVAAEPVT